MYLIRIRFSVHLSHPRNIYNIINHIAARVNSSQTNNYIFYWYVLADKRAIRTRDGALAENMR